MAILKYYKVESDGKIKRLRRECPAAECGAGIFVRAVVPSNGCVIDTEIVDGFPQGSPILREMWLDVHLHAWYQTSCSLDVYFESVELI
jgi:Ribosomal protein S27a